MKRKLMIELPYKEQKRYRNLSVYFPEIRSLSRTAVLRYLYPQCTRGRLVPCTLRVGLIQTKFPYVQ